MSRSRFEYTVGRMGGLHVVELTESVYQQDVQHVPRATLRRRTSARMKFLRDLLGET
jgi:hypothetical protein